MFIFFVVVVFGLPSEEEWFGTFIGVVMSSQTYMYGHGSKQVDSYKAPYGSGSGVEVSGYTTAASQGSQKHVAQPPPVVQHAVGTGIRPQDVSAESAVKMIIPNPKSKPLAGRLVRLHEVGSIPVFK